MSSSVTSAGSPKLPEIGESNTVSLADPTLGGSEGGGGGGGATAFL